MHERISVIGLGKLGVCLAACAAGKKVLVTGVDVSPRTVALVNEGKAPVLEPGLAEMIAANRERLTATHDVGLAVAQSDITFIVVPTPSEAHGGFSLRYVLQACEDIGRALRQKASYHLVVVVSTVLPGSADFGIVPALEKNSGKKCGQDFGVCYSPEFIALGDVLRGMLQPDFALIGESDSRAGAILEAWYQAFCENEPQVCRMNFVSAELTKIAVNTYVTTKITFANMLAAICEQLPGADIDAVTGALGRDLRIGRRYLSGGLGYGGPCFPRDNRALAFTARTLGCQATLAEATDALNKSFSDTIVSRIRAVVAPDKTVAILGLAYKPNTNVIEDSQQLAIARELAGAGYRVIVFDRYALENARLVLGNDVTYANSVEECLRAAEAVVVASPGEEFKDLRPSDYPRRTEPIVVFDCWRILRDRLSDCEWVKYVPLGVGDGDSASALRLAEIWQEPAASARGS